MSSVLELEAWINGEDFLGSDERIKEPVILKEQAASQMTLTNLESALIAAVGQSDSALTSSLVSQLASYAEDDQRATVTNAFLRTIADAPLDQLKYLVDTGLVDTARTDEITDRGCLHEAAIAGRLDVLRLCIDHGNWPFRNTLIVFKALV